MARYDYNLVAVGAGAAGLVSSYIASAVKARVALIEKNLMGGDCLNYGCVPSKSLISSAKLVHQLNQHDRFGLKEIQYQVDFPLVMDRIQEIIEAITPHDSVERYTSLGVECIEGSAKLVSPHELEVNGSLLSTKNIVIATGASPAIPPIPGLEDSAYSTSDSIWKLRELPKQLLVIGGGPIGCELAQAFRRLGSQVTILTRDPKVLPKEDRDLAELVLKNFESEGIQMQTEVQVERIEKKNSEQQVYFRKNGIEQHIKADHILLATGRKPGTSGLGLEEVGVELNPSSVQASPTFTPAGMLPGRFSSPMWQAIRHGMQRSTHCFPLSRNSQWITAWCPGAPSPIRNWPGSVSVKKMPWRKILPMKRPRLIFPVWTARLRNATTMEW